jgi:hypothetical protein
MAAGAKSSKPVTRTVSLRAAAKAVLVSRQLAREAKIRVREIREQLKAARKDSKRTRKALKAANRVAKAARAASEKARQGKRAQRRPGMAHSPPTAVKQALAPQGVARKPAAQKLRPLRPVAATARAGAAMRETTEVGTQPPPDGDVDTEASAVAPSEA